MRWPFLLAFACVLPGGALAANVELALCYNYGCDTRAVVELAEARVEALRAPFEAARDAAEERREIAQAVGLLYRLAAERTPIGADRGGNFADQGVEGRMDCIDHSTNTTRLLQLMAERGWLRFHRVGEPARRTRFILQHFGAVIEEVEPPARQAPPPATVQVPDHVAPLLALCDCEEVLGDIPSPPSGEISAPPGEPGALYVVDSWFVDAGEPAVVLPLVDWLNGEGPNVQ